MASNYADGSPKKAMRGSNRRMQGAMQARIQSLYNSLHFGERAGRFLQLSSASASGPGCVKTRPLADSAESFSQTSSSVVAARSLRIPEMQFGRIVFSTFCPRATFHTAWVNRVTLAVGRPLPVYAGQQTFSESVGNRNHSNHFGSRHPADLSKSARRN
jgi:hypothetical protein